ncbi:MAG: hypothetical protein F6K25_05580 [Okeania sp. SIO2G4]|uniref:hypothetical protein n=1 Tax=unclassified Okeania TaxID=2634635 RepID=UPI0013B94F76|nr:MULTISPECIES: hypothetical protein [unclassified Okeania]NEP71277.1 hypothetical protein [Okeania sp. SIO2G5]NEP92184.1 hypothetical protein [Okeania sp. SIO2F5]NEQ90220.1 hypothetical protein [Okeania sp. SIO2G4]
MGYTVLVTGTSSGVGKATAKILIAIRLDFRQNDQLVTELTQTNQETRFLCISPINLEFLLC